MKRFIYRLFLALALTSAFAPSCVKSQNKYTVVIGNPDDSYPITIAATVIDDGWYNGFPFPMYRNGVIVVPYKKSANHADAGPMMLAISSDGGATWIEDTIKVNGSNIVCAALSAILLPSGRICIGYQDDILYTTLKFAYNDNADINFTGSASTITDTEISFSPVKMKQLPSGKILCGYYQGFLGGNSTIGFIESSDNGVTWSVGSTIFSHTGGGFGDENGYEFAFDILINTGTDATCTLMALVRNASQVPYLHYTSTDGGATWTTDLVNVDNPGAFSRHFLYNFGSASAQSPLDIAIHDNTVYVVNGYRNTAGGADFALQYITASVSDALENNYYNWSSVTTILTTVQNDVNFGYPLCFEDWQGKLWCQYYDVSTQPNIGLGSPRCLIKQVKIAD